MAPSGWRRAKPRTSVWRPAVAGVIAPARPGVRWTPPSRARCCVGCAKPTYAMSTRPVGRRAAAVTVGVRLCERDPVHRRQAYARSARPSAWRCPRPTADERRPLGLQRLRRAPVLPGSPQAQGPQPTRMPRPTRRALRNAAPGGRRDAHADGPSSPRRPATHPATRPACSPVDTLFRGCTRYAESSHEKTRALARALLNDWDTCWAVLAYPGLPLTNNEAERALRHRVVARRIGNGTRTAQGSRAFTDLASIIATCRQRSASPWLYAPPEPLDIGRGLNGCCGSAARTRQGP
jgi:hypothetical protein